MNNIELQMTVKFILVTFRLVLIIFNCAYFTGIVWIIYCDFYEQLMPHEDTEEEEGELTGISTHAVELDDHGDASFMDSYNIYHHTKLYQMIVPMYYAFTSLSTVGFGDYHPKSNAERIFCIIVLLFGVMVFSYIMGVFIEMIESVKLKN